MDYNGVCTGVEFRVGGCMRIGREAIGFSKTLLELSFILGYNVGNIFLMNKE